MAMAAWSAKVSKSSRSSWLKSLAKQRIDGLENTDDLSLGFHGDAEDRPRDKTRGIVEAFGEARVFMRIIHDLGFSGRGH